jgi:hypothetical protein
MAWGSYHVEFDGTVIEVEPDDSARDSLRAWIASLLGADHFNVLLGSGLSIAAAVDCGASDALDMSPIDLTSKYAKQIEEHADKTAKDLNRGAWNIEDQLRSALQLIGGLEVLGDSAATDLQKEIGAALTTMAKRVLSMERAIEKQHTADLSVALPLVQLLLGLTQRPPSRGRTHLFTTNYDRVIEFVCDIAGIRTLDRFVGALSPVFRASRLGVDMHYNPPGIRGEPRYLQGVARLTKLHGSIDWRYRNRSLRRDPLAFGAKAGDISVSDEEAFGTTMIYPNPAKDVETLGYPYAELFRDFSAAICRPGTTLLTYGYGFGDDHLNRVIADMCTVPSTHLLVVSFDDAGGRIPAWLDAHVPPGQRTVVGGAEMAGLAAFAGSWLPAPSLEAIRARTPAASLLSVPTSSSTTTASP